MPTSFLTAAGQWFLGSGIHERTGGVARYYRSDLGENSAVSTEITGYAASAFIYLHSVTGERIYLDRALEAARFLTRTAWDRSTGSIPFEHHQNGSGPEPLAYFFDTGIIARGLLAVWRATGDKEFLDSAAACGRSMACDFNSGADFHPILRLPSKEPLERECVWSRSPGCYQLKAALAWHELHEATGEVAFGDLYERMLEFSLRSHESFLPGDSDQNRVMDRLHAYAYFLEGLLPVLDRKRCAKAASAGLERATGLLGRIAPTFERSDVNAQLLRFRLLADGAGTLPIDGLAAEREAASLASFQAEHFDLRIKGGFWFGRRAGKFLPYVNPVSTAFALQALAMWDARNAGAAKPSLLSLI